MAVIILLTTSIIIIIQSIPLNLPSSVCTPTQRPLFPNSMNSSPPFVLQDWHMLHLWDMAPSLAHRWHPRIYNVPQRSPWRWTGRRSMYLCQVFPLVAWSRYPMHKSQQRTSLVLYQRKQRTHLLWMYLPILLPLSHQQWPRGLRHKPGHPAHHKSPAQWYTHSVSPHPILLLLQTSLTIPTSLLFLPQIL